MATMKQEKELAKSGRYVEGGILQKRKQLITDLFDIASDISGHNLAGFHPINQIKPEQLLILAALVLNAEQLECIMEAIESK